MTAIDPIVAMHEALGPSLADRCFGRETDQADLEAYQRAVYGWPSQAGVPGITQHQEGRALASADALRTMFDLLDEYGDGTMGLPPRWFSDPSIKRSEDLFRLWHAHANRAYRLFLADVIHEDRMREQVALSRVRMAEEQTPMWFWLSEDDALNKVRD